VKISLWIEDGREQIVLTSETDTEKSLLRKFAEGEQTVNIHWGEFYACRGGWTRQSPNVGMYDSSESLSSAIIVLDKAEDA